jgi:hypothetical protein
MSGLDIDPSTITPENIPSVLGAMVNELRNINQKMDGRFDVLTSSIASQGVILTAMNLQVTILTSMNERLVLAEKRLCEIDDTLENHERIFWTPLKVTGRDLLPWMWRNKGAMAVIIATIAGIDWVVRAIQWALVPPVNLP